jgi:hypothetical protein
MLRAIPTVAVFIAGLITLGTAVAQTPAPFPRPGNPDRSAPQPPPTAKPSPPPAPRPGASGATQIADAPNEQLLGVPIYRGAEFITSYDAGRNQRYYLFGTNASFAEVVSYYRTALKQRGELVYDEPPIHEFDVGRYKEETMAFPPGVTVKDYTWGGSQGYLNPKRGAEPARFKTIIQIVPVVPE